MARFKAVPRPLCPGALTFAGYPTSMSDVKAFTVRDLDRTPAKVLAAADRDGLARVRSRDGRLYVLRPEKIAAKKKTNWSAFARARRAGLRPLFTDGPVLTADQARTFDRLLAADGTLL
jgi:hypothetical protein